MDVFLLSDTCSSHIPKCFVQAGSAEFLMRLNVIFSFLLSVILWVHFHLLFYLCVQNAQFSVIFMNRSLFHRCHSRKTQICKMMQKFPWSCVGLWSQCYGLLGRLNTRGPSSMLSVKPVVVLQCQVKNIYSRSATHSPHFPLIFNILRHDFALLIQ